ncbi:LPS assembly lipoprotein LptE [Sulfuritalea sp.]|uniref:LPS-assembly lipoprotein LptE n=1 Tax=Sulfuritalea sp. TaxID=2480090 RepID=UPI00286EA5CC|nr:LPS assembly lipoprotein LptE [Sulfuritalea sp.]
MRAAKLSVILLLISLLAACGFKLRGSAALPGHKLPFATIALSLDPTSEFHAQLKRNIEASSPGTRVVNDVREAEAVLTVLGDTVQKNILSLSASGRAREFQLVRSFAFKVHANVATAAAATPPVKYTDAPPVAGPTEYIAPSTITLRREITFSDDLVLSKESEEQLLWRDIQNDLVQQLMRRLAAAKLQPVKTE